MFIYKTLDDVAVTVIHEAFANAFSDYQVKMDLPLRKFETMLKRRGFVPDISLGAFQDNILTGFILNGFRSWNGKPAVYDLGTGVIPGFRKQGITSTMLATLKDLLKSKNVGQYLLEVIQSNTPAFNLYKKQGFEIVRDFACFSLDRTGCTAAGKYNAEHVNIIGPDCWEQLKSFWDFHPSWQNSIASVNAVSESFFYSLVKIENKIVGYGIIDKKSGDLVQIAVDKTFRRRGIGRSIVWDLSNRTEAGRISVLNVDTAAASTMNFLLSLGFTNSVSQYEMLLTL